MSPSNKETLLIAAVFIAAIVLALGGAGFLYVLVARMIGVVTA
jgi:hypothetical protein